MCTISKCGKSEINQIIYIFVKKNSNVKKIDLEIQNK